MNQLCVGHREIYKQLERQLQNFFVNIDLSVIESKIDEAYKRCIAAISASNNKYLNPDGTPRFLLKHSGCWSIIFLYFFWLMLNDQIRRHPKHYTVVRNVFIDHISIRTEQERLVAALTDGDVRRAILAGASLETPVSDVANYSPRYLENDDQNLAQMYLEKVTALPLVDLDKSVSIKVLLI